MKNAVFWDVTPYSCKIRRFGGKSRLHHEANENRRGTNNDSSNYIVFLLSLIRLLVAANAVPNSPIFVSLVIEAIRSSETSVLTKVTWRYIPEDGILHSHRRENITSYIALTGWTL
jgi:hypothetical protein